MKKIRLGRTNLVVGQLGFGGIPIQRIDRARAMRLLQKARDLGIVFFDTARGYADSEAKIGQAFRTTRDQVVLATKSPQCDAAGMAKAIDTSLRMLRTDRIDLYQIHMLASWNEFRKVSSRTGALKALRQAQRAGKVRFIGVTSHSVDLLARILKEAPEAFDTIQVPFNFVGDESGRKLLPLAGRADVGFIAMKPLGGGVLERPDLALRYVLQYDNLVAIPGMETVSELRQNLRVADECRRLAPDEKKCLMQLRRKLGKLFCRKCNYCQPCPEGITIHLALGARTLLGRFNREMISGWCRDVMRQATRCRKCGICEKRCPYHLPIRDLLVENIALFRRGLKRQGVPW